jgi:LCP family protein required for cell wall assembly
MTRYLQPPPPRRSRWRLAAAILFWLLASAVMAGAGLLGGAYLYFHEKVSEVQARTPEVRLAAKQLDVVLPGKPTTAIVIGYDKRTGPEADLPALSDTIMLVRADPERETVSMLSFPRDLLVEIHCPRRTWVARINMAYSECGPTGTVKTVKALTGIDVHYLITVNFNGFKRLIKRMGGVWVDVDRRYFNDNSRLIPGVNTYATIDLQPGYQRLGGQDALDFVRYRHTDSDFHRIARQQLFIRAFKAQVASSFSATSLPKMIDAVADNVEIGRAGGRTTDLKTVLSYALFAHDLPQGHFFQVQIDGLEGFAELTTAPGNIERAVSDFMRPDVDAPEKAAAVVLGRKVPKRGPRPQDVTLTALNGNGVAGAAADAGFLLGRRGYRVVTGDQANAPSWDYLRTKVYFDDGQRRAKAGATEVAKLFTAADVEPLPAAIEPLSNGAMVTVVVGEKFKGKLVPTPVDRTPKKEKPAVVVNPGATEPLLRAVRKRLPFQLMVPRVLEQTSTVDTEKPLRVYALKNGVRGVRLTFRYGASGLNEYWGIQETDWEDAPILQDPDATQTIGGRVFELHYNGTKLHIVVVRANGATYWVVNTLLDRLSNDTMLAIAKGLRPLRG